MSQNQEQQEEVSVDLQNQLTKLEENLKKLEETSQRLSFTLKELAYLIGTKNERHNR